MSREKKDKSQSIRDALLEQLAMLGAGQEHYIDLIDDYMSMWNIKTKLAEDLKTRGTVYTDKSSVGVSMLKNNPSTKEFVMVNKQMLSLLKELGLSTDNAVGSDEDEL